MKELNELANELEIEGVGSIGKQQLVYEILQAQVSDQGILYGGGVLEVCKDGYGFLRSAEYSYMPSPEDIYLSPNQVKRSRSVRVTQLWVRFAQLRIKNVSLR